MCHDDLDSRWSAGLSKMLFGRHRRSLPLGHPMRSDTDHWFGLQEFGSLPDWPTGDDWLNRWAEVERGDIVLRQSGMKRLAIWNELPYWKVLPSQFCISCQIICVMPKGFRITKLRFVFEWIVGVVKTAPNGSYAH